MKKSIRGIVFILMVLAPMVLSSQQTLKKLGQWGSAPFWDIVVNGNYAYCAAGFAGLEILDISDRSHPVRVAGIEASFSIDNICFNNGFIYASANGPRGRTGSLEIIDLRDPLKPRKRGGKAVGIDCRAIAVQGDYVYLSETSDSTGFEEGIVVFNVSNPDLPVQVGFFSGRFKDIYVRNNYVYALTQGGFDIINVSNPAAPFLASSRVIVGDHFLYHSLRLKGDYAFILGNYMEDENQGYSRPVFAIYNIGNPGIPYKIWESRDKDYYSLCISGNLVYLKGMKSLDIFNISNITQPVLVKSVDIENWSIDRISYDSDNLFGFTRSGFDIFSLDHPLNPSKIASYDSCGHAYGVWASGQKVCLAYGSGGLRMLDVADPLAPKLEWTYKIPKPSETWIFPEVLWGMVQSNCGYLFYGSYGNSEYWKNWRIIDVTDPLHPFSAWTYPIKNFGWGGRRLVVKDRFAYITISSNGNQGRFEIYDITAPSHPVLLAEDNALGDTFGSGALAVDGDYVYCTTWDSGTITGLFHIFKFSNDLKLVRIGSFQVPYHQISDLTIRFPYAYGVGMDYLEGINKLQVFDISNPTQPSLLGSYRFGNKGYISQARSLFFRGHYVYVAGKLSGLLAIDVTDPTHPKETAIFNTPYCCDWVHGYENHIYATDEVAGRMYILESLDSLSDIAIGLSIKRKSDRAWAFHPNYADLKITIWNEDNIPVSRYLISRGELLGTYVVIKEVSATEMVANKYNYRDFGLVNKKKYTYKVEALDAQGKVIAVSEEMTI